MPDVTHRSLLSFTINMASLPRSPEALFPDAMQHWDLDRLYADLATIKQRPLTATERVCLRGLLSGISPNEIAALLHRQPQGLRVDLTRGLYRYLEGILEGIQSGQKIKNWREISPLLAASGYRNRSRLFDPPATRRLTATKIPPLEQDSLAAIACSASPSAQFNLLEQLQPIFLENSGSITEIAFSPDGQLLATADRHYQIKLWDLLTGRCLQILKGHSATVQAIAFSPTQPLLASWSQDTTIRLWSWHQVNEVHCVGILQGQPGAINSLTFSPDGKTLISLTESSILRQWDVSTGVYLTFNPQIPAAHSLHSLRSPRSRTPLP